MSTTWSEQRQELRNEMELCLREAERLLAALPSPAPTLFRERDAEQAAAHAEVCIKLLSHAATTLKVLAHRLAPHLNDCIGYDITDGMVVDLDLPTLKTARAWAEAKHEYTEEDAAEEAAEHRGDMERDGV